MEDIYYMRCGCELVESQLVKKRLYRCPKHNETIDHIIRQCKTPGCSEVMHLSNRQFRRLYCDSCIRERKRKLDRERPRRGETEPARILKAEKKSADHWDCIHRRNCIDEALELGCGHKPLPCGGCDRYETRMVV